MDSAGNSSSMQSSSGGCGDPPDHHQEYDSAPPPLHFHFNTATPPHRQHMPPHGLLPQPPNLAAVDHLLQTPTTTSALIHPHMNINPTNVFLQQPFSDNFSTTTWPTTTSPTPTSIDPGPQLLLDPTYISFHASSSAVEACTTTSPARPPKNPRKRSRASRRAPTTVLTTDTTNFRAMVQEFTGIPSAPPFPGPSSPYSRLLSTSIIRPSPHTPIFHTQPPDPFSFLHAQHPHQNQLAAAGMGYQQLPITNAPFGPADHIPQDSANDPPPAVVVDCINDRGVNQVMTSSSCGASSDLLAQQGNNAEQGKHHK